MSLYNKWYLELIYNNWYLKKNNIKLKKIENILLSYKLNVRVLGKSNALRYT